MNIRHFAAALLLLASNALHALEVTPLLGYRGGGEVVEQNTGVKHSAVSTPSYGFIIGSEPYDQGKRLELYYSHQSTDIRSINVSTNAANNDVDLPLTINYLHFGGTAPITDLDELRTFVSGGIGFTYLSPDINGLDSELRASISLGAGLHYPVTERIGLRLEARWLGTLFNNNSSIFCSGGCALTINGNFFSQYEALAGVSFSF